MRAPHVPRPRSLRRRTRHSTVARAAGVLCVSVLLGSVGTSPAMAEQHDVSTASVNWQYVDDVTGTIIDAAAHDNPGNLTGWTSDAFDTFGQLRVTEPGSGQFWDFVADRRASTIVDGESAEWVLTGSPDWVGFDYDVTLTLTLQGNFARWSYAVAGGAVAPVVAEAVGAEADATAPGTAETPAPEPAPESTPSAGLTFSFGGELGSDDATQYTVNGTTLMSDDGGYGAASATDPVLGYAVTTDGNFSGWTAVPGTATPRADAAGATTFSVDLVYADYNSCGFAAAQTLVAGLLPTLPSHFGEVYPATGECLAFDPVVLDLGAPVDQILDFEVDPRLALTHFFLDPIDVIITDLPAGLETTALQNPADGSIVIHLTGTPTELGEFTATTRFAVPRSESHQRSASPPPGATPVYSSITFRIVPAEVIVPPDPTPDPTPEPNTPPTTPPDPDPATDVTPPEPTSDPTAVTPAISIPPVTARQAAPTVAAQASALRALPTTGIDPGRGLGLGLLTVLAGSLALTALALRSSARSARAVLQRS